MPDNSLQLTDPGDDAIRQAAAVWLAQRDAGFSPAQAAAFARWRDADPRHAAAFRRVEATQQLLARLPESPAAAAMLAEVDALCAARPRVVPFSTIWKVAAALAAAACIAVAFLATKPADLQSANATYATASGQHQSIDLPDGSTVVLNPTSKAEIAFAVSERRVHLQHGEAHFYVAKDASRPFVVSAGTVSVRAVGTAFNVRRHSGAVEVFVTEGKVQVSRVDGSADADREPTYLVAGERAFIEGVPSGHYASGATASDSASARPTAARAPRLIFDNTPLSDVVERFNRYSRVQMEIVDPALAQRAVGGTFDADNAESFINLLNAAGDIRIERADDGRVLLHKAR